jgi:hypothetical protein
MRLAEKGDRYTSPMKLEDEIPSPPPSFLKSASKLSSGSSSS